MALCGFLNLDPPQTDDFAVLGIHVASVDCTRATARRAYLAAIVRSRTDAFITVDRDQAFILRKVTDEEQVESHMRHAQDALRESEARLEAIVRSAMDAIIATDPEQRIVVFNAAAEAMFGCPSSTAIGAPLDRFIPARYRTAHRAHVERFMHTGETSRRMGVQSALWALRADGTEFPIEASISHATVGGQTLLTVIVRDITARLSAEREIQRSNRLLAAIVETSDDAIISKSVDGTIQSWNAAAQRTFGHTAEQAIGQHISLIIPKERMAEEDRIMERLRDDQPVDHFETERLHRDGSLVPVSLSISPIKDDKGRIIGASKIARDITERRALAVKMQDMREAERTRIARELHDELGQALTALKMDVDLLEATLPAERSDLLERAQAMRELLDFTVTTTRRISADLRPLVLDDLGLGAAMEWLMQNVVQRAGLEGTLEFDPSLGSLGEPYASALFRIMQESITNVTRHARARHVRVELQRHDNDAVLTVIDDGIGISPESRNKQRSFGLRGISERVLMLGGSVSVTGQPGVGTTVIARIPLGRVASPEQR
jgi:PAS domain S-box-containing protein